MIVANELEAQGEGDFHLKYAPPAGECLLETLTLGDTMAIVRYNPVQKGLSTLHYRIELARPGGHTEVLVLYSGTASLLSHGTLLHVSEERDGVISW